VSGSNSASTPVSGSAANKPNPAVDSMDTNDREKMQEEIRRLRTEMAALHAMIISLARPQLDCPRP